MLTNQLLTLRHSYINYFNLIHVSLFTRAILQDTIRKRKEISTN